jgi:SAM-dependent methyltransferase
VTRLYGKLRGLDGRTFRGSEVYWQNRYATGGHSGVGSTGKFAAFKAEIINAFVADRGISSILEFGCGDGGQLTLAVYPDYLGFDVSETALALCRDRFRADRTKTFRLMGQYAGERAPLVLSLDVLYHLVEDAVFDRYMALLFAASERYVIIYASNYESVTRPDSHVRHRRFTHWIAVHIAGWRLVEHIPNRFPSMGDHREGSLADFYIYEKL